MGWTAAQAETDHSNLPFFSGSAVSQISQTILQDAGRAAVLAPNTIMAQIASSRKWVPLSDVDPAPTAGKMKCGAFGTTPAAMSAITDGSFKVQIDGETAIHCTGLDFSEIVSLGDTAATLLCGAAGTNAAGFEAVTNGGFAITVDGTLCTVADVNFDGITTLAEVASRINSYMTTLPVECRFVIATGKFEFISKTKGARSTITVLSAGGTTDISGAGFLNGLTGTGTATQGTGSDDSGLTMADVINSNATFISSGARCEWDGSAFTFVSPTLGVNSAVSVLTAGTSGTDISGAGYLNGLTGTGTATAGTGLDGSHLPAGIYRGTNITAAALVAGDVTGADIIVGGPITFDETNVVFDSTGSVTMNSVITSLGVTVRAYLASRGLYAKTTSPVDANV